MANNTTTGMICLTLIGLALMTLAQGAQPKNSDSQHSQQAQMNAILVEKFKQGRYSPKGADSCLACHGKGTEHDATGIFDNIHGRRDLTNGPFAGLQCEACHGPLGDHMRTPRAGKSREPMLSFSAQSPLSSEQKDSVCLSCHQDQQRMDWHHSDHQQAEVGCTSCHQVHLSQDRMLSETAQTQACSQCHLSVRQAFHQLNAHPVNSGQMQCTDCHNPHASLATAKDTDGLQGQGCVDCHGDKRGPFLWEHAPVSEDCSNCHTPHGGINAKLLKERLPQLCLNCHQPQDHPIGSGQQHPLSGNSLFLQGQSCLNCHGQIHGSNHPAGSHFYR